MKMKTTLKKSNKTDKSSVLLIYLCWLVYACAYVGRGTYAANINPVMDYYSVNHADAGLVSTSFFFAYGIGQVVNGLLCKKYNIRWIIFGCLMLSGAANLSIALLPSFAPIKYLWIVNGFSLSVLWPTLIRLLSESLSQKHMSRAIIVMGSTVAAGTFFVYGASALFTLFTSFKAAFFTSSAILIAVAAVWVFALPQLMRGSNADEGEQNGAAQAEKITPRGQKPSRYLFLVIAELALFGIVTNLIKDGLTTWVPSILKEGYNLDDSLSIILTLALPLVSISGNELAVSLHKKIPDYVFQCALTLLTSAVIIGAVILSFELDSAIPALVCFTLVSLLVSSSNSLITSLFPLYMKGRLNSGLIAGVLNGFCYLGSTLSSYGLGAVADSRGWIAVFIALLVAAGISLLGAVIYLILERSSLFKNQEADYEKG